MLEEIAERGDERICNSTRVAKTTAARSGLPLRSPWPVSHSSEIGTRPESQLCSGFGSFDGGKRVNYNDLTATSLESWVLISGL